MTNEDRTMDIRLAMLSPDLRHGDYWTPFEANAGFHYNRWHQNQGIRSDNIHWQGLLDGVEVIRIELDAGPLRARFRDLDRLAAPPLRIQMIETHVRHRRQGIGEWALDALHDAYPDRVLIAFSDADNFWDKVGWRRHINVDDDPAAPGMYPLYVNPRPVRSKDASRAVPSERGP